MRGLWRRVAEGDLGCVLGRPRGWVMGTCVAAYLCAECIFRSVWGHKQRDWDWQQNKEMLGGPQYGIAAAFMMIGSM